MIEKIFIFILFLGPLVFFHELGHFLFARFFGVRVEVFSLGFGPKLFKFKWGDTEYAVSVIPLGGYVKMYGDDPLNKDGVPEGERKFSFTHQGKWARFWIVMGGPLANFVMAYFLFVILMMAGEHVPEMRMGTIPQESILYEKGMRPGDSLRAVNGREITNPSDIVIEGQGHINTITVKRLGERVDIPIGLTGENFFTEFTKYPPLLRRPLVISDEGVLHVLSLSPDEVNLEQSLDQMAYFRDYPFFYFFEVIGEMPTANDIPQVSDRPVKRIATAEFLDLDGRELFIKRLAEIGFRTLDLQVSEIASRSAAEEAGLLPGDIIISLNNEEVFGFDQLRRAIQSAPGESVEIGLLRNGERISKDLRPREQMHNGEKVRLIGVHSAGQYLSLNFIHTDPRGLLSSAWIAVGRTWETMVKTVEAFFRLMTGQISFKSIGGPIAIGQVASDSYNTSFSYFFQLMALISINLGIINLFPIPILDGGHIMFILIEAINRGPISRRKMEIAQQFGLSLLLLLMIGAIVNDVSRFF